MERIAVYDFINGERDYQDAQAKQWDHKGVPSVEAEILLIEEYASKLRTAWATGSGNEEALHVIRKIAGVSTRCLENHGSSRHAREKNN
jgi:hypothetical protein